MGLRYRTIRAAASALLVAAAVGTGGMTGMTSVLAADPGTVSFGGRIVDADGAPLAGIHLVISEEAPPESGLAAFQVTTATDGSFAADVYAWGTTDAPASLTTSTPADESVSVVGETCTQTWGVTVSDNRQLALADAAPDPLTLTASTTLLGEVCGTTATPPPDSKGTGGGGRPALTPPPTDTFRAPRAAAPDRLGPALSVGFVVGLVIAALALVPRPGARRRD